MSKLKEWGDVPLILTTREVADLLQVSRITVMNMLADGRLTGHKIGREWRFNRADVMRFVGLEPDGAEAGDE